MNLDEPTREVVRTIYRRMVNQAALDCDAGVFDGRAGFAVAATLREFHDAVNEFDPQLAGELDRFGRTRLAARLAV